MIFIKCIYVKIILAIKAVLLVIRDNMGCFSADKGIRLTYQAIRHTSFMFLGYICYICKYHGESHCKNPRNRDNSKVPPRIKRQLTRKGIEQSVTLIYLHFYK